MPTTNFCILMWVLIEGPVMVVFLLNALYLQKCSLTCSTSHHLKSYLIHTVSPYVIVGDDAFPLGRNLMKPYPGRDLSVEKTIHNYRLSRAWRVSENAFGILGSRFQIFTKPIRASPASVNKMVKATVALHNYLRGSLGKNYLWILFIERIGKITGW